MHSLSSWVLPAPSRPLPSPQLQCPLLTHMASEHRPLLLNLLPLLYPQICPHSPLPPTSEAVTIGDAIIMQTLSTGVWCLSPLTSSLATIFTAYTFQMHFSNSSLWGETAVSSFQNSHFNNHILLPYYICLLTNSAPTS